MAKPIPQHLTSVRFGDDQLDKLKLIGASLYDDDDDDGSSVAAMVRRAVDEFTERELARPDFREKATEALRRREETITRLLGD